MLLLSSVMSSVGGYFHQSYFVLCQHSLIIFFAQPEILLARYSTLKGEYQFLNYFLHIRDIFKNDKPHIIFITEFEKKCVCVCVCV